MASLVKRLWSGADFWDKDENRKQREEFARPKFDPQYEDRIRNAKYGVLANNPQGQAQLLNEPPKNNYLKYAIQSVVEAPQRTAKAFMYGVPRSITGAAEGFTGLYDLATPGTGTNRITKGLVRAGAAIDRKAIEAGVDPATYRAAQATTDAASFVLPSATSSVVGKAGKVGEVLSSTKPFINAPVLRQIATPANLFNAAVGTTRTQGYRAAREQDISPASIAGDVAFNLTFGGVANKVGNVANDRFISPTRRFLQNERGSSPHVALEHEINILRDMKEAEMRAKGSAKAEAKRMTIEQQAKVNELQRQIKQGGYVALPGKSQPDLPEIPKRNPSNTPNQSEVSSKNTITDGRASEAKAKLAFKEMKDLERRYRGKNTKLTAVEKKTLDQRYNELNNIVLSHYKEHGGFETGSGYLKLTDMNGKDFYDTKAIPQKPATIPPELINPEDRVYKTRSGKWTFNDAEGNRFPDEFTKKEAIKRVKASDRTIINAESWRKGENPNLTPEYGISTKQIQEIDPTQKIDSLNAYFKNNQLPVRARVGKSGKVKYSVVPVEELAAVKAGLISPDKAMSIDAGNQRVYDILSAHFGGSRNLSARTGIDDLSKRILGQRKNQPGVRASLADGLPNQTGNKNIIPQKATQPTKGARPEIPGDKPKGFILRETKPRAGRKDTVRVSVGDDGKLVKTTQSEPATMSKQEWALLDKQADTELPAPKKNIVEKARQITEVESIKDKKVKQDFFERTNKYLGETEAAKVDRDLTIRDLTNRHKLSDKEKLNAIFVLDGNSKPMNKKVEAYVREFKDLTDKAYHHYTKNKGIKMGYVHEYLPRIYKNPETGQLLDSAEYKALQTGSARQKGRESNMLHEDWLVSKDPTELLERYYTSLDKAAAGKAYLNDLEKSGLLVASNEPVRGLKPIVAEGLQPKDGMVYYAPKDVADKLNTMFGDNSPSNALERGLEVGAKVNSAVQSLVLSGGVPGTPINAFGMMQVMKEGMAGHPIKAAKGIYAGMNRKFMDKVFTEKAEIVKLMAENGIDPRVDYKNSFKAMTQRIAEASGGGKKAAEAWHSAVDDPTFARMMPTLQLLHFESVYNKNLAKGSKEAARIAGESVRNFYGINTLAKDAFRSKATKDAVGATLFAPRFREAMVNFWVKNAKALRHPTAPEYRDNVKFMASAALTWVAMEGLNKALTGNWMHDNPDGKKDKLLIPGGELTGGKYIGIPFLPSIATVPRNVASGIYNAATGNFDEVGKNVKSFASMPVQTTGDVLTNEDYFGAPVYDKDATSGEKLTQTGAYIVRDNMQPWVREGLNFVGKGLDKDTKRMLGIKDKGNFETASNALEAPLRFYDPQYFKNGKGSLAKQNGLNRGDNRPGEDERKEIYEASLGKDFMDKSDDEKKTDERYETYLAMQKAFGAKPDLPKGLNADYKKILERHSVLTDAARDSIARRENDYEYKLARAEFERDRLEGKLSKVETMKRQNELLAKQVGSKFSKDIRELYSMSAENIEAFLQNNPITQEQFNELLALDQAEITAGLRKRSKFGSGGRGGKKGSASFTEAIKASTSSPRVPKFEELKTASMPKPPQFRGINIQRKTSTKNTQSPKITTRRGIV